MPRRRKQVDLGDLADKCNTALSAMHDAGYINEVRSIRDFIHAEGNFFKQSMAVNHAVQLELNRKLLEYTKRGPRVDKTST